MIQASVGFHCPNCSRQAQQKIITPAARWSQGATMTRPMATIVLIGINLAVYLFGMTRSGFSVDAGLIGRGVVPGVLRVGVGEGEWWRLITGGFLHGSAMHLMFNMFALWSLGETMERALGAVRFVAAYLSCLLAGSFGVMLASPNSLTVGASGAVFGMFGLLLAFQLSRSIPLAQTRLGMVLAINLGFTFLIPGISIGGHLGGLVGGAIIGVALFGMPKSGRNPPLAVGWATIAAVAVISVLGSVAVAGAAPLTG